jgi:hypothetical protein
MNMNFRERVWKYRIIEKNRREKKNLNGIVPFRAKGKKAPIEITNWHGWKTSLWVSIRHYPNQQIVLDSGIIEELAAAIRRIKQRKERTDEHD